MARIGWTAKGIGAAVVLSAITLAASLGATGGSERPRHAQARISPAESAALKANETTPDLPTEPGYRAHFGHSDLYIPTFFHPAAGSYDLVVHFHGLREAQETNVERTHLNAVIVSVNLGMGSGPYEDKFRDPSMFTHLLAVIEAQVDKSGRAPGAKIGRIALSAWSAGYGSVSALLRDPATVKRVDAVLLADGLHSNYADARRREVSGAPLEKYARIAEAAFRGDKLFALTHSSIPTYGYPSSTETIGELLRMTGTPMTANAAVGTRGMRQIYESNRGDFHVKGYEGQGVKDHIDHIWGMNETLLPYLKERWSR